MAEKRDRIMISKSTDLISTHSDKAHFSLDDVGFSNKSQIRVGIVIHKFASSHFGQMLDGTCEQLINSGYTPVVQPGYGTSFGEYKAISTLLECDCKGIILHSEALPNSKLSQLMTEHEHVVLVNRVVEGFKNRCVYLDNELGAQQAARHLINNGHTNIAMITGPRKTEDAAIRTRAFEEELNSQGIPLEPDLVVESEFSHTSGGRCFRKLLGTQLPFTAVFAQNDPIAAGVLEVCEEKGLRVPEDLSIVGFDDHHQFAQRSKPSLTTIRQPKPEIGRRSAELMNELLVGKEGSVELPANYGRVVPDLIERESVALLVKQESEKEKETAKTLTSREVECLHWIAAGKTSGEIAIILAISENTVNFHLKNSLIKLNSNNRVQAVAKAVQYNIISL